MPSYITSTGSYLPGSPVNNDEMEDYIGKAGSETSNLKELILDNCGITTRHYALDTKQQTTISNAAMAAAAAHSAVTEAEIDEVDLIAAATTLPDLLGPGHASMVHGALGYPPCEVVTSHGICSSGMQALKNAHLQVAAGEKRNAVAVASEFASRGFKSSRYEETRAATGDGALPMEMAFLRYMLSDGAGAAVVRDVPAPGKVNLRVDWISLTSYANTDNPCMFFGSNTNDCTRTWLDYPTVSAAARDGALAPRQQLSLLPNLVKVGLDEYERLLALGKFDPDTLSWLPAHYSSERMKTMVWGELDRRNVAKPSRDAWFSNITRVGNIGSASIFVILDEMLRENMIRPGEQLLCMVPESGRFIISYMHLTAVDG